MAFILHPSTSSKHRELLPGQLYFELRTILGKGSLFIQNLEQNLLNKFAELKTLVY